MTKTIKKTLALILSILMLMSVVPMNIAMAAVAGEFVYNLVDETTAEVIGYKGSSTEIIIPEKVKTYTVVSVSSAGSYPFNENATITSVVIPNTVKEISKGAFASCLNLKTVTIGSGVLKVGQNAFNGCKSVETVYYAGSPEQWNAIAWGANNNKVSNCKNIVYYYGYDCEASGHKEIKSVDAKAETCTEDGNISYWYCDVCKDTFSDEALTIPVTDVVIYAKHKNLDKTPAKDANCTDTGNYDYWYCEICDTYFADANATTAYDENNSYVVPVNDNHDYVDWYRVDGTLTHKRYCKTNNSHNETENCSDSATDGDCNCDVCGNFVAHDFADATCVAPKTCKVCTTTEGGLNANNHSLTKTDATPYTCTTNGNKDYWYCSLCNTYFKDAEAEEAYGENEWVTTAKHSGKFVAAKEPTCKDDGKKSHWMCVVCNATFEDKALTKPLSNVVEPATGNHTYGEGVVTTNPGCITKGEKTYTCTLEGCGATRTEEIIANGHSFGEKTAATVATCKTKGNEAYKQCDICKKYFAENAATDSPEGKDDASAFDTEINPDNHWFSSSFTIDKKATCFEAGSKSRHCTRKCGAKTGVTEIAKREHIIVDTTQEKAPSCTDTGIMNQICTNLGDDEYEACEYTTTRDIPANGHTFGAEKKAKPATCVAKGYEAHKQCTVCEKFFAKDEPENSILGETLESAFDIDIDPTAHSFAKTFTVDKKATCFEAGSKSKHCTRKCGAKTEETEIAKREHTLVDTTQEKAPNCTDTGIMNQVCTNLGDDEHEACEYTTTRDIPANGHTEEFHLQSPTCTQDGKEGEKWCTVCEKFTAEAEIIPALGHDWESIGDHKFATCIADASGERHCKRCDITETDTTEALGHKYEGEYIVTEEATCTEAGAQYRPCLRENCKIPDNQVIPATNHKNKIKHDKVDATCSTEGVIEYWSCPDCGKNFSDEACTVIVTDLKIPEDSDNHKTTEYRDEVPAKCLVGGFEAGMYCADCDNWASGHKIIDPLGHIFKEEDKVAAVVATCSVGNAAYKKCDACKLYFAIDALADEVNGFDNTDVFKTNDPNNHVDAEVDETGTPAKCLEIGYTVGTYCNDCKTWISGHAVIPALGHKDVNTDHVCDNAGCDVVQGECADAATDDDHVCDYGCGEVLEDCLDEDLDHDCDNGCDEIFGEHSDSDKDHNCNYGCTVKIGTCADADKDHDCDYGCIKYFGEHSDADKDHNCNYGCAVKIGTCVDADKDHDCDYGCQEEIGTHADIDKDHACDYGCQVAIGTHADITTDNDHVCDYGCGEVLEECIDSSDNNHDCDVCGAEDISEHSFSIATCENPATCTVCGATRGTVNSENHIGATYTEIENEVEGTCTTKSSWDVVTYCEGCDEELDRESKTGSKDSTNHAWSEEVFTTSDGTTKTHTRKCTRATCTQTLPVGHNFDNDDFVQEIAATCINTGTEKAYCSYCRGDVYRIIPATGICVDKDKNNKCDVCEKVIEEKPADPTPETPDTGDKEEPINCDCNCHKSGIMGLLYDFILFFQRLFGFNKTCDCGRAHY